MRLIRALFLFKLGFWAGTIASAALMKRMLPSRGDAESDDEEDAPRPRRSRGRNGPRQAPPKIETCK